MRKLIPLVPVALFLMACPGRTIDGVEPNDGDAGVVADASGFDVVEGDVEPPPPPQCDQGLASNITIESEADLSALDGVRCLDGNLSIRNVGDGALSFPELEEIYGNIVITDNAALTTLTFGALTTLGGDFLTSFEGVGNAALSSISLPLLDEVRGRLIVNTVQALDTFNAPLLRRVEGTLSFVDTLSLSRLTLPALEFVGGNVSTAMDGGESVALVNLTRIDGSLILNPIPSNDTRTLRSVEMPRLESLGEDLFVGSHFVLDAIDLSSLTLIEGRLQFSGNVALPSITFEALEEVRGNFSIQNNLRLAAVFFPALNRVGGDLSINANNDLPDCLIANDLLNGVTVVGAITVGDNRAGCTCDAAVPGNATCQD